MIDQSLVTSFFEQIFMEGRHKNLEDQITRNIALLKHVKCHLQFSQHSTNDKIDLEQT